MYLDSFVSCIQSHFTLPPPLSKYIDLSKVSPTISLNPLLPILYTNIYLKPPSHATGPHYSFLDVHSSSPTVVPHSSERFHTTLYFE